jgi:hypothetical protein
MQIAGGYEQRGGVHDIVSVKSGLGKEREDKVNTNESSEKLLDMH